jgi:hypothetical protein
MAASVSAVAADAEKLWERVDRILEQADTKRLEAIAKADREYRLAMAEALKLADRVEVFLLDFSMGEDAAYALEDGDAAFPIAPYRKETKILKTSEVPAKEVARWTAAVGKLLASDDESGAACHLPIHGLRFYTGSRLLFETSLCWKCENYYFTYGLESRWLGLGEDARELKALLEAFMPIPKAEADRLPGVPTKVK